MAISRRIGVFLIAFTVLFGAVSLTGTGSSSLLPATNAAAASAKLSLRESQKLTVVGQPVKVVVKGEQLTDLYGFEFKLKYDTAKLKFMSASAEWEGMAISPIDKNGVVTFAHTKVGASAKGVSGTAAIATFTFEAAASGKTGIELLEAKLVDSEVKAVQLKSAAKLALLTSSSAPIAFSDIKGHWAESHIGKAALFDLVTGYENGTFQPNGQVTRAQFAVMLSRAFMLETMQSSPADFKDKDKFPGWAEASIMEAVRADVIDGYDDGTFRPDRLITRAEMATMIMRASRYPLDEGATATFADAEKIPVWAKPSVASAVSHNLLKGRSGNRFEPQQHATRAEAVTIVLSLVDALYK